MSPAAWHRCLAFVCASSVICAHAAPTPIKPIAIYHPDHYEFSASLHAPFHPDARGFYSLALYFDYPGAGSKTLAAWQVDVQDAQGQSIRRWIGETGVAALHNHYVVAWDGRDGSGHALKPGFYTVRLRAVPNVHGPADFGAALFDRVHRAFVLFGSEEEDQRYDVMVGNMPAPKMPAFHALPRAAQAGSGKSGAHTQSVPATGSLPYTIYYGNLHSQTNHSDGAGPINACTGEQAPQSQKLGPTDAYTMAQNQAHADFLMTSEHNHMFDGSTSTNTSANPATAKALFASGLTAMANYNAAHPGFLALYGVEWGVISNGGHMNIFNADGLPEWELNSSGQLLGDYLTPKSDYAGIYATMKAHGWIGQFNHPAASGQFAIGGTSLAYDANGDQVMVTAEVLNSYAFSTNTTETESSRNSYQAAYDTILERGFHVAPSSDQDNHCANWGLSYRNRTGVLLPNGTALNVANFLDALRARRVFAAEDKNGQLILTANGQIMGQTISNSGPLTLVANYASATGQTASRVQFFTGVPGSNGTVAQLYEGSGTTTTTPSVGSHYYYVLLTQANGDRLWSAPIWVNEVASGGDTTPPTATASETGSSGTITLSSTASDNVGVTRVEFYVDGVLKGTDTTSPYSMTLNSTTLANGSHTLTAKAYDAANNFGTSTGVSFSINNAGSGDTTPPTATASESGSSGTITLSASATDNVGVSTVEFYIDGVLKGSDTTSPYGMTLDSTTLANGSHTLTVKAYDPAGNVGTSTGVAFSVSNTTTGGQFSEVESNNSIATANVVSRSYTTIVGTMSSTTDKDYFGLALNAGDTLKVVMTGPSGTNYNINLLDATGRTLTSSSGSTSSESITYTSATAQTVYPEVVSASGSSTTKYTLTPTYTAGSSGGSTELIGNGSFESGNTVWTASSSVIDNSTQEPAHAGNWKAWLDGYGSAHTDTMTQAITIPSTATTATLTFWLEVGSDETSTTKAYDTLAVQVRNSSNAVLATLHTYSNLDKGSSYVQRSFDLSAYKGQAVKLYFTGTEDAQDATSFLIDDVSVKSQ